MEHFCDSIPQLESSTARFAFHLRHSSSERNSMASENIFILFNSQNRLKIKMKMRKHSGYYSTFQDEKITCDWSDLCKLNRKKLFFARWHRGAVTRFGISDTYTHTKRVAVWQLNEKHLFIVMKSGKASTIKKGEMKMKINSICVLYLRNSRSSANRNIKKGEWRWWCE